jgi:hypothetical protein
MVINARRSWVHSESDGTAEGAGVGAEIVKTNESALPPEPHVQVYVPGVNPRDDIVPANVADPDKLAPEVYVNGRTSVFP